MVLRSDGLPIWLGSSPVAQLIRETASHAKGLLIANLGFALLLGLAEAGVFAVLYRVIRLLSGAPIPIIFAVQGWSRGQIYVLLLISMLLLQVVASTSRAVNSNLSGRFAALCQARVVPRLHRFILGLSFSCASSFKIGDLAHRASLGPLVVNTEIEQGCQLLSDGLLSLVYMIVLVMISPWLMLLAGLLALGMSISQGWLRPRIRAAAKEVELHQRNMASAIASDLQVLRLLHSSAATEQASRRFSHRLDGLAVKQVRLYWFRSLLEPIAELMPMLAVVGLGLLSWQLTDGQPTVLIPGLATFVLALQRLNIRLVKLGVSVNMLTENMARVEILNDLLRKDDKLFRRKGGQLFWGLRAEIAFDAVGLRYADRCKNVLIDIAFVLPRNSTIALVGSSGSGKSTVADLLVGLLEPSQGRILIDGVDLRSIDLDSWQRCLGVVTQDVLLVNDTIAANIAFGLEGQVSPEAIREAAIAACAHDFISQLPAGYATVVGERGHRLSGGQRQRLSLARAILRQPEVLILDEATSALDSHAEAQVQHSIQAFSSGRTVLAIAHRLSSIRDADLILVIEAGRIVERGSHNDLIGSDGRYASLWRYQQQHPPQSMVVPSSDLL